MLVDLQINFSDYFYPREMKEILQKYGDTDGKEWDSIKDLRFSDVSEKLHNGVYQFWDFNGEFLIERTPQKIKSNYPWEPVTLKDYVNSPENYISSYGVCDNFYQVLEKYKKYLEVPNRKFVVILRVIRKDLEPADGGWRWHKWGEYIGTQNPQMEYIHDEPEIEKVYVYHIYELE